MKILAESGWAALNASGVIQIQDDNERDVLAAKAAYEWVLRGGLDVKHSAKKEPL